MHRREFLTRTGLALGAAARPASPQEARRVSIVIDPEDAVAAQAPARWAAGELEAALAGKGVGVERHATRKEARGFAIVVAGSGSRVAGEILRNAGAAVSSPESLVLADARDGRSPGVLAAGADARGLVYALTELADRVRYAGDPLAALAVSKPVSERPANVIRSAARLFTSDVEDLPWFLDREMWPRYLSMLAAQRFNRFNLSLGIGYDFLREVTDAYFLFAYPFLLPVEGFSVRARGLADHDRDRNLEMLRFISSEAAARGLDFQLGLWTHGYQWTNSPHANYTIEGLSAENHAAYCRGALTALLRACPAITGVTMRIHGESGVAEGSYGFWKTVFEGAALSGRKVELDLHSKGIDQSMIDAALSTGLPVNVSPKYWAEHMGMPYHQAAIRELEMPRASRSNDGFFALSSGSRSFTRYGYADLLREDRRFGVLHRIWPGTHRLLLWGDPLTAAAYSRAFGFCGSRGVEVMEPLSFKGRRGSGIAGDRCAYNDARLRPRWDWEKYLFTFRVWGRLLYNPEADPSVWRRSLQAQFGEAAPGMEAALANGSRILPILTTAHLPSAANNNFWPEIYTNQPIVDAARKTQYEDSPAPRTFGRTSPLDPQLFSRIDEFADEMAKGERGGKYSPVEVAQWLEDRAAAASRGLTAARTGAAREPSVGFLRAAADVELEAGLGRFFALKLRAGVLWSLHERTGSRRPLEEALKKYAEARAVWKALAEGPGNVYTRDITAGELPWLRGHWLDRLPAIDGDIEDMRKRLAGAAAARGAEPRIEALVAEALGRPQRESLQCSHTPPARFEPGRAVEVEIAFARPAMLASARMHYRHVNQAERYTTVEMQGEGRRYRAAIPGTYTNSPYPLQYYFELKAGPEKAWLVPGFALELNNQPYYVVRRA
jgi:hypothetical protein